MVTSLRHHGVQTDATVTADSEQAKNSYCDVRFTDADGKVWNVRMDSGCGVSVGHEVAVVYDPQNPDDIDLPQNLGTGDILGINALIIVFGLLFFAASVWTLRASRERFSDINRRVPRRRAPERRPTSHRRDDR